MLGRAGVASSGLGPVDGVRPYHGLILGRPSCCFRTGLSSGRGLGALNLHPRGLACLPVISQALQKQPDPPPSPRKRHATRRRDGKTFPRLSGGGLLCPETLRRCARSRASTRIGMMRTAVHGIGPVWCMSCGWWPVSPSWRRDGSFVSSCGLDT